MIGGSRGLVLRLFLGSIAVNAGLGIWALLIGDFGETEGKILVTSLLVSAAMLSVLVNRVPLDRRVLWPLPFAASIVAVASFGLLTVVIWAEIDNEVVLKLVGSGFVVAAGATLVGLLALVALPPASAPMATAAAGLIAFTVVTALVGIWAEIDDIWYLRLLGVESVLIAAVTLAIPAIARFTADTSSRQVGVVGPVAARPAVLIDRHLTLRTVIDALVDCGDTVAFVCDADGVAGAVSAVDILAAIHDGADLDEVWAADVMTDDVIVATTEPSALQGATLLAEHGANHLVVYGEGVGVVSTVDLLRALAPSGAPT